MLFIKNVRTSTRTIGATVFVALLLPGINAHAQEVLTVSVLARAQVGKGLWGRPADSQRSSRPAIGPLRSITDRTSSISDRRLGGRSQLVPPVHNSTRRSVGGAVAGGVAGFFAGGFLGAKLEPACYCDDPGVKGFLIGAPIGTIVGAILGRRFL